MNPTGQLPSARPAPATATQAVAPGRAVPTARAARAARIAGWTLLLVLAAAAAAAAWWLPHTPTATDLTARLAAPSAAHPLGTDHLGRDVLVRLVHGARASFGLTTAALLGSVAAGTALGMTAGWHGRLPGTLAVTAAETLAALPTPLIALVFTAILGPGTRTLLAAVLAATWPPFARLAYQLTVKLAAAAYVEAAVAAGTGTPRLIARHLLPNAAGPLLTHTLLRFPATLLTVAGLSFLGLGPQPPAPEWGAMLAEAHPYLERAPLLVLAPAACIVLAGIAVSTAGHAAQRRFAPDPTQRH